MEACVFNSKLKCSYLLNQSDYVCSVTNRLLCPSFLRASHQSTPDAQSFSAKPGTGTSANLIVQLVYILERYTFRACCTWHQSHKGW